MLVVVNNSLVIIFMFSAHEPQMTNNLRPIRQIIPKVFIVISKILCKVLINHHIMPWKRNGNHHHQHHDHTNVTIIITKIIIIKSKVLVTTIVVLEREWWLAGVGDCSNFHESESQRVTHTTFP